MKKEQPQIVITDIRMPIMSGLELATHIHTHYPQIKVILVTGYSDFEYARTAIQNNVFEYLLKPIDSENLIAVILRAQKEIESAEKNERLFKVFKEHFSDNLQSARRQFVENLLFRSGVFQNADDLREAYGFNFKTYRLVSVCCRTAMDAAQLESEYYCTHLVDEYMQEAQPGIITYIFGNLVFMLWNVEKPDPYDDNEALLGFLRDLHAKARRNFLGMLSAGISQASSTLNNIQTLRHQTSECLEYMQENKKQEFRKLQVQVGHPAVENWSFRSRLGCANNVKECFKEFFWSAVPQILPRKAVKGICCPEDILIREILNGNSLGDISPKQPIVTLILCSFP